jgi:hypothetical protein
VGGAFTLAGGQPANRVARWDGSAWHSLGEGVVGDPGAGVFPAVWDLAVSGSNLYVGGSFTAAGGQPANHVARWDGSAWHALGDGIGGQPAWVSALAVSELDLYVGGYFTEAGGQPANFVARWDGSAWYPLGDGPNGVTGQVMALAVSGSDLFVGGLFTHAVGQPVNRVARWDGMVWHILGVGVANGVVRGMEVDNHRVFVGGGFGQAGGAVSSGIATFVQPLVGFSIDTLDFDTLEPGQSSAPSVLTITNDGAGNLDITAVSIEAMNQALAGRGGLSFTIEFDDCTGASLASGESCSIAIVFSPSQPGLQRAVLRIDSNAPGSPTLVELTGNEAVFSDRFQ